MRRLINTEPGNAFGAGVLLVFKAKAIIRSAHMLNNTIWDGSGRPAGYGGALSLTAPSVEPSVLAVRAEALLDSLSNSGCGVASGSGNGSRCASKLAIKSDPICELSEPSCAMDGCTRLLVLAKGAPTGLAEEALAS
jgi:hypothetical protein